MWPEGQSGQPGRFFMHKWLIVGVVTVSACSAGNRALDAGTSAPKVRNERRRGRSEDGLAAAALASLDRKTVLAAVIRGPVPGVPGRIRHGLAFLRGPAGLLAWFLDVSPGALGRFSTGPLVVGLTPLPSALDAFFRLGVPPPWQLYGRRPVLRVSLRLRPAEGWSRDSVSRLLERAGWKRSEGGLFLKAGSVLRVERMRKFFALELYLWPSASLPRVQADRLPVGPPAGLGWFPEALAACHGALCAWLRPGGDLTSLFVMASVLQVGRALRDARPAQRGLLGVYVGRMLVLARTLGQAGLWDTAEVLLSVEPGSRGLRVRLESISARKELRPEVAAGLPVVRPGSSVRAALHLNVDLGRLASVAPRGLPWLDCVLGQGGAAEGEGAPNLAAQLGFPPWISLWLGAAWPAAAALLLPRDDKVLAAAGPGLGLSALMGASAWQFALVFRLSNGKRAQGFARAVSEKSGKPGLLGLAGLFGSGRPTVRTMGSCVVLAWGAPPEHFVSRCAAPSPARRPGLVAVSGWMRAGPLGAFHLVSRFAHQGTRTDLFWGSGQARPQELLSSPSGPFSPSPGRKLPGPSGLDRCSACLVVAVSRVASRLVGGAGPRRLRAAEVGPEALAIPGCQKWPGWARRVRVTLDALALSVGLATDLGAKRVLELAGRACKEGLQPACSIRTWWKRPVERPGR